MWYIVKTDVFTEQKSIDLLGEKFKDTIVDFYFPMGRRIYKNEQGEKEVRFTPVLQGLFFIRVQSEERLESILSQYGYFMYKGVDYRARSAEVVERTFFTKAHILCADSKSRTLGEIVKQAKISDDDMERFIYYNDKIAEGIEGLSIVAKRYSDLIKVNDTIRIINGPMTGWVGVVKQVKHKGKKDRHLFVRFGNNLCLNISNVRQYDMQIEHEATVGAKPEAVGAWRAIDQLIGYLQAKDSEKNASDTLRNHFKDYLKKLTVYRNRHSSDIAYSNKVTERTAAHQEEILSNIDDSMRNNFRILANYFKADGGTVEQGLKELIPDIILRPFFTPTSGIAIPQGQDYAVLCHNGIVEFILRCNLRKFFRGKEYEADKYAPVFDEDYEYYAHFALLETDGGKVKAICSWGGFYDYYASQNKEEREKFHANLQSKKYPRLLYLLMQSEYKFEKVNGIGGFSIETDIVYTEDMEELGRRANEFFTLRSSLFTQLTAAAVEMWQGARMLVWRQLLQRYVLLHKVPVIDLPSVITHDSKTEEAFVKADGRLDINNISVALAKARKTIEEYLEKGELAGAVFKFLSASLVFSSHFAQDELYNYITDTFNPDYTFTELFDEIINHLSKKSCPSLVSHLHKGMVELQEQESWTYFKFPSFLKQTRKIVKMVKQTN
ncbi:hypothetical protein [Segatella hominis]|uniref:Uncharacterized protein n=1 Tax=Segatella hominis TaxID=2518605 RepID=A0A4Y8VA69_9BACT|nr:hypothetical protein [Segatella hominis]TFH77798.1 hypothetical protein EXN75_12275 [Segatella hominis]